MPQKRSRTTGATSTRRRAKSSRGSQRGRAAESSRLKRGAQRAGSAKGLAKQAWAGLEAGRSQPSARGRSESRSKDIH
jgi:hypothetical protein